MRGLFPCGEEEERDESSAVEGAAIKYYRCIASWHEKVH